MQRHAMPTVPKIQTNIIEKYAKLSENSDAIKGSRASYVNEISTTLRATVAALPFEQAVEAASRFDGLICLPALIASVNAIKADYEEQFHTKYGLNMSGVAVQLEKEFEDYLDIIIADIIKKKRSSVTQKEIDEKAVTVINEFWQRVVKAKPALKGKRADAEFVRLIKNYAFIVSASKVYRDTDEMQMLDFDKLTAFNIISKGPLVIRIWRMTKEKMIESYRGLDRFANQLNLIDAEKQKWTEVAIWLFGLYNRVYRCIPAAHLTSAGEVMLGEDGNYPTVDEADKLFLKHKGITKYFMSLFNRGLAQNLAVMTGMRAENNVVSSAAAAAVTVPSAAATAASSMPAPVLDASTNASAPLPQSDLVHCEQLSDGRQGWRLTVEIPDCEKGRKDNIIAVIEDFFDDETLSKWLRQCEDAAAEDKINRLDYCIRVFPLSLMQSEMLSFILADVKVEFKRYRNSSYLLPMTHAEKSLVAEQQIESTQDPKHQMEILFLLRDELVGENSNLLKKAVEKILLSAFNQLVMPVPESVHSLAASRPKLELTYELIDSGKQGARISVVVTDEEQRNRMISVLSEQLQSSSKLYELCRWVSASDNDKITRLALCLRHNELSANQSELLQFVSRYVISKFAAYRSRSVFFSMKHAEKSSVAEKRIANAQSPKDQLTILLELRNELIGDNSDHLLKAVDSILLSAFNALVMLPDVRPSAAAAAARM